MSQVVVTLGLRNYDELERLIRMPHDNRSLECGCAFQGEEIPALCQKHYERFCVRFYCPHCQTEMHRATGTGSPWVWSLCGECGYSTFDSRRTTKSRVLHPRG